MIRPRSPSSRATNASDGITIMLRPSGRTPWRIMAASCASSYLRVGGREIGRDDPRNHRLVDHDLPLGLPYRGSRRSSHEWWRAAALRRSLRHPSESRAQLPGRS